MLISHKHQFITIDIPKTGSRSLRESLMPLKVINLHGQANLDSEFYQHDGAIRARKQFAQNGWNWGNYFKFTIVRNPWADTLVSLNISKVTAKNICVEMSP